MREKKGTKNVQELEKSRKEMGGGSDGDGVGTDCGGLRDRV